MEDFHKVKFFMTLSNVAKNPIFDLAGVLDTSLVLKIIRYVKIGTELNSLFLDKMILFLFNSLFALRKIKYTMK